MLIGLVTALATLKLNQEIPNELGTGEIRRWYLSIYHEEPNKEKPNGGEISEKRSS